MRKLTECKANIFLLWERISIKFVLAVCFLSGVYFTFWAGISSNVFDAEYAQEMAKRTPDSLLINILVWIAGVILIWGIWKILEIGTKGNESKIQKRLHIMVIVLCVLLGIALSVWINIAHYTIMFDQKSVFENALEMSEGNYSTMEFGGYAYQHPYQLRLAFVYQVLFKVFHIKSYRLMQYLNIICILLAIYFGYRIVTEITQKAVVQVCYMIFSFTFIPLFIYSQFVYGDVCSLAMENMCIWGLMRWCDDKKVCHGILTVLSLLIGSLVRITFSVMLIAVVISLLYHIVKVKCRQSLILLVLCVAVPLGSIQLVNVYYSSKSGLDISRGLPLSYRLHYAMQEGPDGPGTFNLTLLNDFAVIANYDSEYFDLIHKAALKRRIQDFLKNPAAIPDFYQRKLLQQWNDHTFSSRFGTHRVDGKKMGDIEWSVYYGRLKRYSDWYMDRYLFIFYLSFAIGIAILWKVEKDLYKYVSLIACVGGVLFSMLFESKGRYVMPYVILMQPFAAIGLGKMLWWLEETREKAERKFFLK